MPQQNQAILQLSIELKLMLYKDEIFKLLPGCGWMDGGCRSLMKAMLLWLGEDQAIPYLLVKRRGDHHAEHTFVRVGPFFIDGEGVSTRNALYKRWRFSERMLSVFIRPFTPEEEPDSRSGDKPFYISEESIRVIAASLEERIKREVFLNLLKQ